MREREKPLTRNRKRSLAHQSKRAIQKQSSSSTPNQKQPRPCCQAALQSSYDGWLHETGANDHPWMLDNLRMALNSTMGDAGLLSDPQRLVRVAWISRAGERFTWAQRLQVRCPDCGTNLNLFIVTSNSMFFLLRLLVAAYATFVGMQIKNGKIVFKYKDATDELVEQVHAAMQIYRGYRELTDAGLKELFATLFKVPNRHLRGFAGYHYTATVVWLLLHEVGHAVGTHTGIFPLARTYLDAQNLLLDPQRHHRWLEELSADFHASLMLAGAAANRLKPKTIHFTQVARDTGFGCGVLTLVVFELFEGYDAGNRAIGEKDIATAIEFRTHPPMRMRQHFLEFCGKATGGLNQTAIEPWRKVLHSLFANYVDRHPIPD
jgi:hypothetical protein